MGSIRSSIITILTCTALAAFGARSAGADMIEVPLHVPTIQGAIDIAVDGDTVLVAPGTYVENINFLGKAITVTSESGPEVTIIDGNGIDSVVKFISGEKLSAKLHGFTLQNGDALRGGGIYIDFSSPTISDSKIVDNTGCLGLGIYISTGSPVIRRNIIKNNRHTICHGGGRWWNIS